MTVDEIETAVARYARLHLPYDDQPPQCDACARGKSCDDRTLMRAGMLLAKVLRALGAK